MRKQGSPWSVWIELTSAPIFKALQRCRSQSSGPFAARSRLQTREMTADAGLLLLQFKKLWLTTAGLSIISVCPRA